VLVLTRKVGERILIGDNIAVTVVKLTSGGVRIGVEAPPELAVVREELARAMNAVDRSVLPYPLPESTVE
jgi:carbon storage regulator